MRVRRQARLLAQFVPKIQQALFRKAAFEERTRIHARRRMALIVNQVSGLPVDTAAEKVVERNFADCGERCIGGYVSADVRIVLIRAYHHGGRVPANKTFDAPLQSAVTRVGYFFVYGNRVHIRRVQSALRDHTRSGGPLKQFLNQIGNAVGPFLI